MNLLIFNFKKLQRVIQKGSVKDPNMFHNSMKLSKTFFFKTKTIIQAVSGRSLGGA